MKSTAKNSNRLSIPKRHGRKKFFFTLIELLVVISVIAILAGILLAAVTQAKSRSKGVSCINNIAQMSKANVSYSVDYGFYMPTYETGVGKAGTGKLWVGDRDSATKTIDLSQGFMAEYITGRTGSETGGGSADLLICPGWQIEVDKHAVNDGAGYGYNSYGVGSWGYVLGCSPTEVVKEPSKTALGSGIQANKIMEPSQTVSFSDICNVGPGVSSLEGYSFLYPYYTVTTSAPVRVCGAVNSRGDNVHFRHSGTASVGWVDGHVSSEKPTRLKDSREFVQKEMVGNFGPQDNSLYDPWGGLSD